MRRQIRSMVLGSGIGFALSTLPFIAAQHTIHPINAGFLVLSAICLSVWWTLR